MVAKDYSKKSEELKEKIFASEQKRAYSSERFTKIENQVRESLKKQNTDEALKDITI
jgi:secreted Zn-dependent insulinase-like peptidase